ncbi:MAG: ABC transporter permease [Candidatus Bathyarchaeota archaeon]|nr:ABC transporter permease [Candidatus Bathyarchaeota archaeon]
MTAKTILKHSFRIAWKDLLELFRNRLGLVLLVVMPLFMMVMVGFIYPTGGASISNMPIAMVNEDAGFNGSTLPSQTFFATLQGINDQTGMMTLTNASSLDELRDLVQRGELSGGIVLPSNFSECILTGQQGTVIIITDQSNPQISATIQGVLSSVFENMGTVMSQQAIQALNPALNATTALAIAKPLNVQSVGVVPGNPSYFDFIAPGIMAMTVMMSVMTGLPVAISQEKEIGTMDGMMVAPVNRLSILLGKTMAQTARGLIQGCIILALAIGIFGVTIQGSILLVFALLLLGVFSFVGLGIVITSFTKDQETAQMLMMTLMFPMMFLSGVFFPIQQMPWYMQDISKFLPLTYASDALRKVMVLGAGVPQISNELIILIAFGVVMIAIALPVFRRMMTR